jgi:tetratricopeptide (TPR) repeat protein
MKKFLPQMMKPIARVAAMLALCLVPACGERPVLDPVEGAPLRELDERRSIEPRVTGAVYWSPCTPGPDGLCAESHKPAAGGSTGDRDCPLMTADHNQTVRTLLTQPQCIDAVIAQLAHDARKGGTARLQNDLAAGYYVRARNGGGAADLIQTLEFSERALEQNPALDEAHFNRALAEEALGLTRDAATDWERLRARGGTTWGKEAGAHWQQVMGLLSLEAATQWPLHHRHLPEVVRAGNLKEVAGLIAPFPAAAQRYVENELLPRWAGTASPVAARESLHLARVISVELAKISGERYLLDAVEQIEHARGGDREDELREAYVALGNARSWPRPVTADYRKAVAALHRAGSPLALGAGVDLAVALTFEKPPVPTAALHALLDPVAAEASRRGYRSVWARVQSHDGYLLLYRESRYVDALAAYDAALRTYRQLRDPEGMSNAHTRKNGILQILGRCELAADEAYLAQRDAGSSTEVGSRHITLGESATAALCLDAPHAALVFQQRAVRMIQDVLSATPPADTKKVDSLRHNLAVALRARGAIEARLDRNEQARRDASEAVRLANSMMRTQHEGIQAAVLARIEELKGRTLLRDHPEEAVAAFSRALHIANPYQTFHASLLAELAEARQRAGQAPQAERDLRHALDELRAEEKQVLITRRRGSDEKLWSRYFDRAEEGYRMLVRQLVERHRQADAFDAAERARAFEPLHLVMESGAAPPAFRRLVGDGEPLKLAAVKAALPPATFLIELQAGPEQTLAWVVSHDHFEPMALDAGEEQIDDWGAAIERGAHTWAGGPRTPLGAAFEALLARPLAYIESLPEGRSAARRLVIIPHGSSHAIPFAALWDPHRRRYLVQDWTVAVAPSATLYIFSLLRDAALPAGGDEHVLLAGDPAFNQESDLARGLHRLPFAREEVADLKKLYGDSATVLAPAQATAPNFLEAARGSTVVHLAGHAIVNPREPYHSTLLLAPSAQHTGALEAEELLTALRPERGRLFVLSACSSAGGVPIRSEGLGPLVRPLIGAGVPAVAGSIWQINDSASRELMVWFHTHYRHGKDAAAALRLAQLDAIRAELPLLAWAPFEVIGYASSPFPSTNDEMESGQ